MVAAAKAPPPAKFGTPAETVHERTRAFRQIDELPVRVRDKRGRVTGEWKYVKRERLWLSGAPARGVKDERRGIGGMDRPVLLVNDTTLNDSNKSFTVPTGEDWEILWVQATLTTTAVVGNRFLILSIFADGSTDMFRSGSGASLTASGTHRSAWAPALPLSGANSTSAGTLSPLPFPCIVPSEGIIQVLDNSVVDAAADDMIVRVFGVQRTR